MKKKYHIEITKKALEAHFSQDALNTIIKANIRQDCLFYQLGHDHFHFDSSAFSAGFEYISQQYTEITENIRSCHYHEARKALGRILHTWQDFYSHSNYIQLWKEKSAKFSLEEIDHDDRELFGQPNLKSGKNYGVLELFAQIPGISALIRPYIPADSHVKMNLDSPKSGDSFLFAYQAAFKRCVDVRDQLLSYLRIHFCRDKNNAFTGK
jgi:hypothetical protein